MKSDVGKNETPSSKPQICMRTFPKRCNGQVEPSQNNFSAYNSESFRCCGAYYYVTLNAPLVLRTACLDALFVHVAAAAAPEAEFTEHDNAVWSLDVQPEGNLAVSGAEDGITLSLMYMNHVL